MTKSTKIQAKPITAPERVQAAVAQLAPVVRLSFAEYCAMQR